MQVGAGLTVDVGRERAHWKEERSAYSAGTQKGSLYALSAGVGRARRERANDDSRFPLDATRLAAQVCPLGVRFVFPSLVFISETRRGRACVKSVDVEEEQSLLLCFPLTCVWPVLTEGRFHAEASRRVSAELRSPAEPTRAF